MMAAIPKIVIAETGQRRFVLALTRIWNAEACAALGWRHGSWVVALDPGSRLSKSAIFGGHNCGYLAPAYVAEKLDYQHDDIEDLAEIIADALDRPHSRTPRSEQ